MKKKLLTELNGKVHSIAYDLDEAYVGKSDQNQLRMTYIETEVTKDRGCKGYGCKNIRLQKGLAALNH